MVEGDWVRVQHRISERWPVIRTEDDFVVIGDDSGAEATLQLRAAEKHLGFVVVCVEVVGHNAIPIDIALAINNELQLGGLCVRDGVYVLRHALGLETTTIGELDRTIAYLLGAAATIRRDSQRPNLGCFTYYED